MGSVIRLTDLDRPLTMNGDVYASASLASVSAERRDSGLRASSQEAHGLIDGVSISIPDLLGDRYVGAWVWIALVDWRQPWRIFYNAVKEVEDVVFLDDGRWRATLVGKGAKLARPVGGRFGGTWQTQCPYRLGDMGKCRKNIAPDVRMAEDTSGTSSGSNSGRTLVDTGSGWTINQWAGYRGPANWRLCSVATADDCQQHVGHNRTVPRTH